MTVIKKIPSTVLNRIATSKVDSIIRNYKKERWIQNSEKLGKEDSLSVWWSIEEIECFIEQAKIHGGDGIKFYFGAYGSDETDTPEYAERQTLAMVATKKRSNDCGGVANKDLYVTSENGNHKLVYNIGGAMCPPRCGAIVTTNPDVYSPEIGVTLIDKADGGFMII